MDALNSKPVAQVVAAIEALDLEPIKFKLMDAEDGQGWSREQVETMAVAYKRFLTLLVTHPETQIAPSKDIDKFWHGHILDTMKYAEDCEKVFGYFLHHFPYFGMRGKEDAAALAEAGEGMARLYEQEFGEPMPNVAACGATVDAAACGATTKAAACGATTNAAACGATTNAAACGATTKAAACGATTKAAACGATTNAAACGATTKAAACGATIRAANDAAACGAAVKAAACGAAINAAARKRPDFQTRPTLAKAA
jgi:hypothetical protein